MRKGIFITLSIFISSIALAQKTAPASPELQKKFFDSSDYVLPIMIDVAKKVAPENKRQQALIKIANNDLKQSKNEILRSFNFNSNYSFGSIPTYLNSSTSGGVATTASSGSSFNAFNQNARALYTVGIGFNLNFEQLFGGIKTRVDKQKLIIEETNADTELLQKALKVKVITQYQALLLAKILYDHAEDALQTAYVNKTMVDKQFKTHEVKVTEEMAAQDLYEKAVTDREQTKSNYKTALLLLEDTLGMSINDFIVGYIK